MAVIMLPPADIADNPFFRRKWEKGTAMYGGAKKRREHAAEMARRKALPKGTCYKCGKHIGSGIHLHLKACDDASQNAS